MKIENLSLHTGVVTFNLPSDLIKEICLTDFPSLSAMLNYIQKLAKEYGCFVNAFSGCRSIFVSQDSYIITYYGKF